MQLSDIGFALLGIPRGVLEIAASEGRYLRTKARYPHTKFARGVNADNACSFEEGVVVHENTVLSHVRVGAYSYVANDSIVWHCKLGRFCSIGPEVRIGLGIHPARGVISTYPGFYSGGSSVPVKFHLDRSVIEHRTVTVGNDVWIGARAMLLDGVSIGDGAVVAAGSIVTRDVAPYCVVAGSPARVVRTRFTEEQVRRLVAFAWWDRGLEFCTRHAALFATPEKFFEMVESEGPVGRESSFDDSPRAKADGAP